MTSHYAGSSNDAFSEPARCLQNHPFEGFRRTLAGYKTLKQRLRVYYWINRVSLSGQDQCI
jgi:hypothetical protein